MKTTIIAIAILGLNFGVSSLSWGQTNQVQTCKCRGNSCSIPNQSGIITSEIHKDASCKAEAEGDQVPVPKMNCTDESKNIWVCSTADTSASNDVDCDSTAHIDTDKSKKYGCKYGGASAANTQNVNNLSNVASTAMDKVGQMSQANANANATNSVLAKGVTATNTDYSTAQAGVESHAAALETTDAMVMTGITGTQLMRAKAHEASIKIVLTKAQKATSDYNTKLGDAQKEMKASTPTTAGMTKGPMVTAYMSAYGDIPTSTTPACSPTAQTPAGQPAGVCKTIWTNANAEMAKQKELAQGEALTAAGSGFKAMTALEQASMDRAAAAATTASASGFAYNPGTGSGYSGDGTTTAPTPDPGENLGSADNSGGNLASANQINPNPNGGLGGVAPTGAFTPGTGAPAPAAGAGNLGTASGTSAAKDDSANKDNTPPSKTAVGSYSAGDTPAGYSRNNGNNGPSVGLDSSFADMMKKFLPGGEDEKKPDGSANFNDRTPASDAATVIARNKNIFEEVHKRYEKKNTEGAIVF
jgi:hypothetical protein